MANRPAAVAVATVSVAVGFTIVLRRLRALQLRVDALSDLVKGHETSLQYLTQRVEPLQEPVQVIEKPSAPKPIELPQPAVASRGDNLSRQDSWQSMNTNEEAGYKTAEEDVEDSTRDFVHEPPAGSIPGSMGSSGTLEPESSKWSCVSTNAEAIRPASVPPSPAGVGAKIGADPDSAEAVQQAIEQALQKADERYNEQSYEEAHALLTSQLEAARQQGRPLEAQVLWRLARICKEIGGMAGARGDASGKAKEVELLTEGLKHATAALDADDAHFATHKWYAIMVSLTSGFEGTKATIQKSFVCKKHFERAIELNPADPTSRHLLGLWYYEVAGLSWTMRKVAATLFAEPPTGTYAEAKGHFAAAEEIEPGFYVKNRLMLGKACLQLNDRAAAKAWFEKALELPANTVDDEQSITEARKLLNERR